MASLAAGRAWATLVSSLDGTLDVMLALEGTDDKVIHAILLPDAANASGGFSNFRAHALNSFFLDTGEPYRFKFTFSSADVYMTDDNSFHAVRTGACPPAPGARLAHGCHTHMLFASG